MPDLKTEVHNHLDKYLKSKKSYDLLEDELQKWWRFNFYRE